MADRHEFPDPDERPNSDVVIWDGHCRFCLKQVKRLRWFDFKSQLAYLSLHDERVAQRYPDLGYDDLMAKMWVVTDDGQRYGGADAGRYLSRKLPGLWWLAPLLHTPFSMPLWRRVYARISQSRYNLAGETCDVDGTCHLHVPAREKKEET